MPKPRDEPSHSLPRYSLHLVPSIPAAWETVLWPWFEQVLPRAWKQPLPSLVVVPTRAHANDFRARLTAKGASHLGLQFVTPTTLRALLARDDPMATGAPEHLRLLLAIAATEREDRASESEALAAEAVARAPGVLLRTLDRLAAAGWKFQELTLQSFAPIVRRFNELLKRCDFLLPGEIDRRLLERARNGRRKFSSALIVGFDGAHWSHWFLLRAAAALSAENAVVIEEPSENFSDVDLCWIGSWEEICGEAQRATVMTPALTDSLFTEAEMRGASSAAKRFDFLIGTNFSEQAEAIARQCVRYLADSKCSRLGVIFPGAGALSRLVSSALGRLEILHNDGLGHVVPGIFESPEWQAWLELQRAPRLNSFLRFLNALPDSAMLTSKVSRQVFENVLRESYNEILLADLDLLREFCAQQTKEKSRAVAEALRNFPFLGTRCTLVEFLEQTRAGLEYLGWRQHALEIESITREWPQRLDLEISRGLFLRWLEETAATFAAARSAEGDHPYARVQLLTVPQAQNQEWSHLIFAGWNEGAWPPPAVAAFAREDEIREFNRSAQQLNKRAARQGSQGEGHVSVRESFSFYLGPAEQRAIALRQFDALIDSVSESVTLTASLVQEDAPERFWNPSECFTHLYLQSRGEALTQSALKNLQAATRLLPKKARSTSDVDQTLIAFNARRDSSKPVGQYDFALRSDESYRPLPTLSVSDLERMVSSPALVWVKRYLGVEAPEDTANSWTATTGKWVHRWLAGIVEKTNGKLFATFPSSEIIDVRICASADDLRASIRKLCQSSGKTLPDWWSSGWLNARYLARHLGSKIGTAKGWGWIAAELPIGRDGSVKIADGIELQLRGQIDLVLAQNDAVDFAGQKIWIVDYKTGPTREQKKTDLHDSLVKGTTLQLGLYSLAIRALGAADVGVSIVSFAVKNIAPQLFVVDLEPHTNVFADLAQMQRTGVFGMKGEIRPSFGYSTPYPLATLSIDNDILEDKWALSHPALVLEKEEWETW
jgi:hypothetical protein